LSRPDTLIGGRYRLVSPIATGGMGTVWEAWDERLHRRVALKQLHPQPGLSPDEARLAGDRALREARITARLHHPHAVPVYDVVDHEGQPCLVMQYLSARSLQQLLAEKGPLSIGEVARIGSEIASALEAAHEVGIVHRDVKPGNVLIEADGAAKLTDFGISHALGDPSLTSTGIVTGTPAYLAPEVARGAPSTAASDVFSLGSTLYTAVEGTSPFGDGQNPMATLHRAASGQITPPRRTGPMTPVLQRMLAVDPAHRPSTAEVAHALRAIHRQALDPAAFAATQQLAPPHPPGSLPPSSTVVLPPAGRGSAGRPLDPPPPVGQPQPDGEPERSRGRGAWIAAAVAVALILAGVVALLLTQAGGDRTNTAGTQTTTAPPTHRVSTSHRARASTTTSAEPTPSPTEETTQQSSPPSDSESAGGGAATQDPATAVSNYYALLPGDTDTAWNLLTKHFQNTKAQGRATYDAYWASIESVSVSNARTTGDKSAEAAITYVSKDGETSTERTAFQFKNEHGVLKIDETQVLGNG
jgi:serine/threonine protein kinase